MLAVEVDCCSATVLIAVGLDLSDEIRLLTPSIRPDGLDGLSC